jgi:hypothetical protein
MLFSLLSEEYLGSYEVPGLPVSHGHEFQVTTFPVRVCMVYQKRNQIAIIATVKYEEF